MASEQDAARDRVLAARADLAEQLHLLEASGRSAVDIPAKIKRSPAKVAAVAGGVGFLALKGPQRVARGVRRVVRGKPAPMPSSMLPDEIEKTLRKLGSDGDKVRGALERDFADYAKQAQKSRQGVRTLLLLSVARPVLARASKAAADFLLTPDPQGFAHRLEVARQRAEGGIDQVRAAVDDATADAARPERAARAGDPVADERPPEPPRPAG